MGNEKQKAKSGGDGIDGWYLFGGLIGVGALGATVYGVRRAKEAEARRWLEAQRREEQARQNEAWKESLRQELQSEYEKNLAAAVKRLREEAAERERLARESAAREARAAEQRRDQEYRKREAGRDRKFEAHEEGRSRIASDQTAQQSRRFDRWFAERDAEIEPLRQHGEFLRDLAEPTRPAAPSVTPISKDPEMADVYAELSRFGRVGLDG